MWWLALPFVLQGIVMMVDEFWFHHRRSLGRWERIGHPVDTATVLVCFGIVLFVPFSSTALAVYSVGAVISMICITKDEFVHAKLCPAGEHWLHSVLFMLHPILMTAAVAIWADFPAGAGGLRRFFAINVGITVAFWLYQIFYWNFLCRKPMPRT
jgi:uncharacterized membrane protein